MRIVSLIASSTEIVCALGYQGRLVGISHECDYPASVRGLPVLSEVKFAADGKSYQIDQRIRAILQEGLSVYRVRGDELKKLSPDVILTQIQCQVCAVSERDVLSALYSFTGTQPQVVSLNPNCLADLWEDIRKVALALQDAAAGERLIDKLQNQMRELSKQAETAVASIQKRAHPRVACIEWIDPLMSAGNWMPELIPMAGGVSIFGQAGKHSPYMSMEELVASDPDIILVTPCGFDLKRTREEMPVLLNDPRWRALRAIRDGRAYLADGNQYFNRPGPRLVESLQILCEILHPDSFEPRLQGTGWERASGLDGGG